MSDYLLEELLKASDRIKSGKRTTRDTKMSAKDIHTALGTILKDTNLSASARQQLSQMHKEMKAKAEKEAAEDITKRPGFKPLEVGSAAQERAAKEAATQAKIDEHLKTNQPKKIDELGHGDQMARDVNNPKMRSKTAEKLTGGVKQRLATGEGMAVRDKQYGANLDLQRKMKAKEEAVRAAKGPSQVITVKANPMPEIPEEHANDDVISNLVKLRGTLSHPDHLSAVDGEISSRIKDLSSGTMKKSVSESFSYNSGGQWFVKTR